MQQVVPEKLHTLPTGNVCCPEGGRGGCTSVLGCMVGRFTSNFLYEGGLDIFWNDPTGRCLYFCWQITPTIVSRIKVNSKNNCVF